MKPASAEVIDFATAREALDNGTGEPPMTGNWLRKLKVNDRFIAKLKSDSGSICQEFIICEMAPELSVAFLRELDGFKWRLIEQFSKDYQFIVRLVSPTQPVEEATDGSSE